MAIEFTPEEIKILDKIQKRIKPFDIMEHTGSTYVCDPAPEGTDIDFIIATDSDLKHDLIDEGFTYERENDGYTSDFISLRKGRLNLILSYSVGFAEKHVLARDVCKYCNILDKNQRIAIFHAIQLGEKDFK